MFYLFYTLKSLDISGVFTEQMCERMCATCKMFFENGDVENCGVICIGQTGGLIHEVLSVKDVIDGMMAECKSTLAKFDF